MTQEEFIKLCAEGNYTQISEAIRSGINPNIPANINGIQAPAMFIASSSGNKDAIKALTEHGVDTSDGFTASVVSQNIDTTKYLIECGGDINKLDSSGHNALLTSVTMNKPEILEKLISLGADVNAKSEAGHNALTYAAMMSSSENHEEINPEIVKLLMKNKSEYWNAMILAIKSNNENFARLIIDSGADLNITDENNRSLVMYSVMTGGGVLRMLLENGADPNIHDENSRTPLMIAAIDYELEPGVIDTLLEFGAKIDDYDEKGFTALIWAVAGVDREPQLLMPAFIRTGGMMAEGWEKWCAFISLYTAAKHELQIDIVRHLVNKGADVNKTDKRGMNALMYALVNGDDESADILSDAGAKINFVIE